MNKEFVMRGQTASGETETLNFSGYKPGYAYRLVEFGVYPTNWDSTGGGAQAECVGSITAGKTAAPAIDVNFNDEGLIGNAYFWQYYGASALPGAGGIVNDTFLITQNLILMVQDNQSSPQPVNWQCRFVAEKMSGPEEAVANYKQFTISDE